MQASPSVITLDVKELKSFTLNFATVITLLEPFKCPGSDGLLNPSLYVTFLAHIPLVHRNANQVMVW